VARLRVRRPGRACDGLVLESQKDDDPVAVVGMSFLQKVEMRRVGDTLTLTRRNF
jgi:hypothetical protein